NGGCRIRRISCEHAERVSRVLRQALDPRDSTRLARRLFHILDAAELDARASDRRLARQSLACVSLGLALEMVAHLVGEILLEPGPPEQGAQPVRRVVQELTQHAFSSCHVVSSTIDTVAVKRFHASDSATSCFRPS